MNIKKAAVIGMCCTIITTSTVFAASNTADINEDIKIQINHEWVTASVKPFIKNDRTLVGLNEFMEKLGAKVENDAKSGEIKISYEDVTIELIAGEKSGKIIKNSGGILEEEEINLEVAPELIDGNIFVPIRFAAEAMGFDVEWDDSLRAVIIKGEGDTIVVEKPVKFETVSQDTINGNEQLINMYNNNRKIRGIYHLIDGDYIYVLVSAGEKPTGGYGIMVDSITEVAPGTAYIHATLNSPGKDSIVTQALTYPSVMVKFEKGAINNFQWDLSGDIKSDEAERNEITKLVQSFGEQLKMVSLLAPEETLKETMNKYYGDYVSQGLIEEWLKNPESAPGKLTSSPWPGRIDVLSVESIGDKKYEVKGNIVEFTSVEMVDGEIAAKREITLKISNLDNKWVITGTTLGNYEKVTQTSVVYRNEEYGFNFSLPESWKGYTIQNDLWKGTSLANETKGQTGPVIYIRHPQWTKDNPRQDIPVMVLTPEQWKAVQDEKLAIGAAPIPPKKLGENSKYVFALPARYNFEFLTGYEEVEKILENNPLKTFETE